MDTACSSAIPTSKVRLGKALWKAVRPVPEGIAAVMAQILGFVLPSSTKVWPKDSEKVGTFLLKVLPVLGSNLPIPWNLLGSSSANL